MKIHKLEIENIRGIPSLTIEPNGKSFVVYGTNGSGKSAVIDALDFLLTGHIERLEGKGTDGISLKDHGAHINKTQELENVSVKAEVTLHGSEDLISISRNMKSKKLEYDSKNEEALSPILDQLQSGQHVFTRREILKLITSPSGDRNQEILRILKLEQIETARKSSGSIHREAKSSAKAIKGEIAKAEETITTITEDTAYKIESILKFVNDQREVLGKLPIEEFKSELIKKDIDDASQVASIVHEELDNKIKEIQDIPNEKALKVLSTAVDELDATLTELEQDKESSWNNKRFKLSELGLELLKDTGECPLCDHEWSPGHLEKHLRERNSALQVRQDKLKSNIDVIESLVKQYLTKLSNLSQFLSPISKQNKFTENLDVKNSLSEIKEFKTSLENLSKLLYQPDVEYFPEQKNKSLLPNLLVAEGFLKSIETLQSKVKELFPEATKQQSALSKLIRLEERSKYLEEILERQKNADRFLKKAKKYEESFVKAKDEILNELYSTVKDRFVQLYRDIHAPDEINFEAELTPEKAGLKFKVDFYGKGYHPPHAMHSEGHQDSMGICLFLALSEKLNQGVIDLSILDDVVMSVDSGHRKAFCKILGKYFSDKQFIITTHDTTWAVQLQKSKVVQSNQMLKLYGWSVDDGPLSNYSKDVWSKVQSNLDEESINDAAAKLRRGLEEWARMICGNLRAAVPYSPNDSGGLSDFMSAGLSKYRKTLKEAKNAAKSWGRDSKAEELEETISKFDQIRTRCNDENWVINPTVHYNEWENFTKSELQEVFDAYKDMRDLLLCANPQCGSAVVIHYDEKIRPASIKCGCEEINYSLKKKS